MNEISIHLYYIIMVRLNTFLLDPLLDFCTDGLGNDVLDLVMIGISSS